MLTHNAIPFSESRSSLTVSNHKAKEEEYDSPLDNLPNERPACVASPQHAPEGQGDGRPHDECEPGDENVKTYILSQELSFFIP